MIKDITPEFKANEMLRDFIGDKGQTPIIVLEARDHAILACKMIINETGSTFFYRVIDVLEALTFGTNKSIK